MFNFDLSDAAFGLSALAVLTYGWGSAPPAEATHQTPLPEIMLTTLHEQYIADRQCEARGMIINTGPVALPNLDLRLTFEATDLFVDRVAVAATLKIENLVRQEKRVFAIPYSCDDAIGSRRYRADVAGHPIGVRSGLRRVLSGDARHDTSETSAAPKNIRHLVRGVWLTHDQNPV